MRKVVVLVLIFSLITCNTVVVLAANETEVEEPGTVSPAIPVEGSFTKAEDEEYSIDILWGSMEFTYISNNEVWDVTSHQYVGTVGTWSIYDSNKNNVNKITVTNHSSDGIKANLAYKKIDTSVVGDFYDSSAQTGGNVNRVLKVATAVGTEPESPPKGERYLRLSGRPTQSWINSTDKSLGDITVAIEADS